MQKSSLLLNSNFILLWQGQFVSLAGTSLGSIALALWIAETTRSATLMGTIMMITALPGLFLMPVGGAFADRHERKKIIVSCDLINGMLALCLAGAFYLGTTNPGLAVTALVVVSLGMTVTDSFFIPAVNAITPDLVKRDQLLAANALIDSTTRLAGLAGKLAGGALYRLLGAPMLLLADGLTFLVSAVSESFIRVEPREAKENAAAEGQKARNGLLADVRNGLIYIWQWQGLRLMVLASAGIHFFMAPLFVLLPFYVTDSRYLGAPADWYGYIMAGLGAGAIAGAWLASPLTAVLRQRRAVLVFGSLMGAGLGIFLTGVAHHPWAALMLITASGMLFGLSGNLIHAAIQTGVPGELRGRVLSVATTMAMSLSPLALGLAGVLADVTGRIDLILAASGLLLALIALLAATSGECRKFLALKGEAGKGGEQDTATHPESA
jgi:MFS transporter, DHA3 family, macrolide efflux protein